MNQLVEQPARGSLEARLDPSVAFFPKSQARRGWPAADELSVEEARGMLLQTQASYISKSSVDVEDRTILVGPRGNTAIRIVRPRGSTAALPAVIYFHGGGWVLGDEETHDWMRANCIMKTYIKNPSLLTLIAGLVLILAGRVSGQTFTTLHSFTGFDGAYPQAGFIFSGNTLYGTAANGGGAGGPGAVFAINADGSGFTNLHGLTASEGAEPYAGLILSGDTLYGTTSGVGNYGSNGNGTVFAVKTNGTGYTNLYSFTALDPTYYTNRDGKSPRAGLVLSGNTLYGTAIYGGSSGKGTVFAVNTDGTGFTNLHSFKGPSGSATNNDGNAPWGGLVLSGNTLYGTTAFGSGFDNGTLFKINTDGTGYTNFYNFTPIHYNGAIGVFTNTDGANPFAGLILSGDTLYGTANNGGAAGSGTVFAVSTNGTGFRALYSFTLIPPYPPHINSDGSQPYASLLVLGNTLYGTAAYGGGSANGTVFALRTNGTGFTILHSFAATALDDSSSSYTNSDGANPFGGLMLSGNTLYGTANQGGGRGIGTVFSLSLPQPQLTIIPFGGYVILTWPTNAAGFMLQSTTNLFPTAWSPVAQAAVTNAGQISVTVPATVGRKFFRLTSSDQFPGYGSAASVKVGRGAISRRPW